MRIEDALGRFTTQLRADGRSPHTVKQYERHVRALGRWMSDRGIRDDVAAVDHESVAAFLTSPAVERRADGGPRKATSANAIRSSLRGFFRYAHEAGHLTTDPTVLVRPARCSSRPTRGLTAAEQRALLCVLEGTAAESSDTLAPRDRAAVNLMLAVGLRIGTLLALDVDDLRPASGALELRAMKGGRADCVPVPGDVMDLLVELAAGRGSGPIFLGRGGERLGRRQFDRRLKHWGRQAGLERPLHAHALRHCVGQRIFDETGCVLSVAAVLRHASVASSARYARVGAERLREIVGRSWEGTTPTAAAACS